MRDSKEKYGRRSKVASTSQHTTITSSIYNSRGNYLVSIVSLVASSCNIYWLSGSIQNCSIFETSNALPDDIRSSFNTSTANSNATINQGGKKPHEWNAIQYSKFIFTKDLGLVEHIRIIDMLSVLIHAFHGYRSSIPVKVNPNLVV